jgi:hypothetical protein
MTSTGSAKRKPPSQSRTPSSTTWGLNCNFVWRSLWTATGMKYSGNFSNSAAQQYFVAATSFHHSSPDVADLPQFSLLDCSAQARQLDPPKRTVRKKYVAMQNDVIPVIGTVILAKDTSAHINLTMLPCITFCCLLTSWIATRCLCLHGCIMT